MKFLSRYTASLLFCCLLVATTTSFADIINDTPKSSQETKIVALKNFVNSAIQYIKQKGRLEAYKEFSKPQGKFTKDGMYIFVAKYTGEMLAHGGDPTNMVGANILNLHDEFGSPMFLMFINAAKNGGGTVGYYWKNYAKKNTILFKITYVKPLDSKTFIGGGYYENKQ